MATRASTQSQIGHALVESPTGLIVDEAVKATGPCAKRLKRGSSAFSRADVSVPPSEVLPNGWNRTSSLALSPETQRYQGRLPGTWNFGGSSLTVELEVA